MTLITMTTLSAPMMPMTSMMAMILCQCTTSVRSTTQWAEVTTEPLQTNIYSKHPYEYINISTQLSSIVPAFVYYRLHWQQLSKFDNREKKKIYIKKKKQENKKQHIRMFESTPYNERIEFFECKFVQYYTKLQDMKNRLQIKIVQKKWVETKKKKKENRRERRNIITIENLKQISNQV